MAMGSSSRVAIKSKGPIICDKDRVFLKGLSTEIPAWARIKGCGDWIKTVLTIPLECP